MSSKKTWKRIELEQTCGCCPEQYEAYLDGTHVGYLRLRYGYFSVRCGDVVVYGANTEGHGSFHDDEREKHLKKAKKAIAKHIKTLNKRST